MTHYYSAGDTDDCLTRSSEAIPSCNSNDVCYNLYIHKIKRFASKFDV